MSYEIWVKHNDYTITYYSHVCNTKLQQAVRSVIDMGEFEGNEILPGMFIGNIDSSYDKETLKKLGITHLVVSIAGYKPPYPDDFKYMVVHALDSENTYMDDIFNMTKGFIDDAFSEGGKVMIVCMAGRSRSATIAASYIIATYGFTSTMALELIRKARIFINPNPEFCIQLTRFSSKIRNNQIKEIE
jgi:hypothetical protein